MDNSSAYWNEFYREAFLGFPSQFAAFAIGETVESEIRPLIIDLGCGNGRDLGFFASQGFDVVGMDSSAEALRKISEKMPSLEKRLFKVDFSSGQEFTTLMGEIGSNRPRIFYSRFVLHSLGSDVWERHVRSVAECMNINDRLFLEFRTHVDDSLPKVTKFHFRRGVDPTHVLSIGARSGLRCEYYVEGFGFAKYKADNAHVARIVFGSDCGD